MMGKSSIWMAALLAGVSALPAAAEAQPRATATQAVPPLSFTSRTLPNGLKIYAVRDTRTANVSVQMWYGVGSRDDPAGRSGFAHLFEHILSRVTRNIPHGELSRIVEEQAGGTRNASTRPDSTSYYETVPASQLEAMLWAHAERMGRSVLDQQVFETERNIVKEEMRQRVLAEPYGRLQRYYLFDSTFTTHPYARSGIGTMADLDAASLADARAFHENFYRPDNATLVVSGNFDPVQLNRWIDRHLAPIPRPNQPILRFAVQDRPRTSPLSLVAYGPNVPLPAVVASWQRPRLNHPDSAALAVLDQILAGGQSSRLHRSLVYERQLAQSVATINYGLHDAGLFAIQATAASGKDPAEVEAALNAELARLRDQPVTEAELAEARNEIVSATLFERETPDGRASQIGEAVTEAGDPRWSDTMLAAVRRVTAADVRRVARAYLRDDDRVSIRYLDDSQRGAAAVRDPSAETTRASLGRTLPPATGTPNQLAPEGERIAPPAPAPQRPFTAPAFAERRLANGMRVVVARSSELPIATANLVFGGGAAADPADRPGTAAMMANLVRSGTASLGATEIATRIESIGATLGATSNADSTIASVAAPVAQIDAAGALLGDMVRNPAFALAELERERRRGLDGMRVALRNPTYVNNIVVRRALYGEAPYGAPAQGTPASLAAISRDEIAAYHRSWWRPDNATLIITGALDAEAGFALAERLFGDWRAPAEAMPTLPASRAGQAAAPRVIVVDNPQVDQASVSVALRAIPRDDSDYYPLVLANSALGGSSTGRLFQEVRVRRGLSYGAYSGLVPLRDEGLLFAQAQTRNNAAAEVAEVMLGEVRRLAAEPLSPDVLQRRQTLLTGAFGRNVETSQGLGTFLANLAVQGLPMEEYGRYLPGIAAVTPEQIAASVRAELDPAQASIVIVGRASEFLEALRARYPDAELIPFAELDLGRASLRAAAAP